MMVKAKPAASYKLLRQIFPSLSEEDLIALDMATVPAVYGPGKNIVREGDPGTSVFVLGDGQADIFVHAEDGQEILVDTIGPDVYFGEMSLFGETARTATIRAKKACHTLEINHTEFLPIAQSNPTLLQDLLKQIIGHLRRNDRAVIRELNIKTAVIQDAYADLAEQEELRSRFIATLSHELRTPLTSIQGFIGLINQGVITGDSLKVAMQSVTRNVDKLVGLTNNMLILYEMYPGTPTYTHFNPTDAVVEALNALQLVLGEKVKLVSLNISDRLPEIYADKSGLVLAIRALIENAIKFNPEEKPVEVKVFCPDKTQVAYSIVDQGIGIPEEEQDRIFEPFYRIEQDGSTHLFPGLGIGLTIAEFIITKHNGRIEINSYPDEGSTFTILLPIH